MGSTELQPPVPGRACTAFALCLFLFGRQQILYDRLAIGKEDDVSASLRCGAHYSGSFYESSEISSIFGG